MVEGQQRSESACCQDAVNVRRQVEEISGRFTFQELDANKDSSLSLPEIKMGLEKHGIQIPSDLETIISALDTDGSGNIDYTEFIAASITQKQYSQKAVLWAAFRRFDTDGNGLISE